MAPSAEARARIAAQQAALVMALTARGEVPTGFDPVRLRAAADSLARKREQAAARAWPALARALGPRFGELFTDYAEATPRPRDGGPLSDGRTFARWLSARGELPEDGQLQALAVDLRCACTPEGHVLRRWPTCQAAWLPRSRRLIVALWLPWLGAHWLSIRLGKRQHDDGS